MRPRYAVILGEMVIARFHIRYNAIQFAHGKADAYVIDTYESVTPGLQPWLDHNTKTVGKKEAVQLQLV